MAARARRLGITARQVDYWAREGLITVPGFGSGVPRRWDDVTDRRLAACALVMTVTVAAADRLALVDEIDRRGWTDLVTPAGRIRLELDRAVAAAA